MSEYKNLVSIIGRYTPVDEMEVQDKRLMLDYMRHFERNILKRENEVAHVTVSGFILNKAMDKTLMVHHHIYKSWGFTGGHADGNPDLLVVAIEEAQEETGIQNITPLNTEPQALDIIAVWSHYKNNKPVSAHLHLNVSYFLLADESEQLSIKEDENSGVQWIPLEEVESYCSEPQMMPIYRKLIKASSNF